eukprot:scaffold8782_cov60-Phaeocystis_antarctica.AAC.4
MLRAPMVKMYAARVRLRLRRGVRVCSAPMVKMYAARVRLRLRLRLGLRVRRMCSAPMVKM